MPNLHVTDRQVMLYMTRSQQHDQESAAAMAGFSARTARRIDKDPRLPSQKRQPRTWRTRTDPLTDVWPRVLEMLKIPGMMAVTIFEDLQDEVGPEVFPDRVRRTLERRIARWRALHGEDKEVYFPQRHDPGRQALSDFTVTDSLGVTIAGEPFPHRLYHFRLACSGWEHVRVILGGESFSAVAEGLQDALWKLGGVPREHRTDTPSPGEPGFRQPRSLSCLRRRRLRALQRPSRQAGRRRARDAQGFAKAPDHRFRHGDGEGDAQQHHQCGSGHLFRAVPAHRPQA